MNLGAPELMIILLVTLVLFGGAKLPKLARSLGEAQSEFRNGLRHANNQDEPTASTSDKPPDPSDERVTMTKAELDALLAEHENRFRQRERQQEPPSS